MKTIRLFPSEKFQFLVVKFSVYLNRHVFVMERVMLMTSIFPLYVYGTLLLPSQPKLSLDFHEKLMSSMPDQRHALDPK